MPKLQELIAEYLSFDSEEIVEIINLNEYLEALRRAAAIVLEHPNADDHAKAAVVSAVHELYELIDCKEKAVDYPRFAELFEKLNAIRLAEERQNSRRATDG